MPEKDNPPDASKLISSFDSGTVDTGFGESTIPGFSPDFQTGQFSGLSEMIDPALDGDFSERTQTDLMAPMDQLHDDDTAERMSALLMDCLSVIDDFDRLVKSARQMQIDAKLIVELEVTRKRFLVKLQSYGVEHRRADGQTVDLAFHEVVREVSVKSDAEHDKIVSVEREGYVQSGQVLRRAKVVVGKKA